MKENLFTMMTKAATLQGFDSILIETVLTGTKFTLDRRLSGHVAETRYTTLNYDVIENEAIRFMFHGIDGWDVRITSRGIRLLAKDQSYASTHKAA